MSDRHQENAATSATWRRRKPAGALIAWALQCARTGKIYPRSVCDTKREAKGLVAKCPFPDIIRVVAVRVEVIENEHKN